MEFILTITILLTFIFALFLFGYSFYYSWSKRKRFEKSLVEHRKYLRMEKELDTNELVKKAYLIINDDKKPH